MAVSELPKTMLAWRKQFEGPSPARIEIPVPTASPDGLLLQVLACGICHSDHVLAASSISAYGINKDYTMGHEGCGRVVEVGADVSDFAIGDIVSIQPVPGCGEANCPECSRGYFQLCQTGPQYGLLHDGSFAPYVAILARAAVKVPAGVPPKFAAVATDAALTAYAAVVRNASLKSSDTVVIIGLGGLGLNALQIALYVGANVIAVDTRQEVLDKAVELGLDIKNVVPVGTSVVNFAKQKGLTVDKVIDFAGVQDTFDAGLDVLRLAGTYVQVGAINPIFNFASWKPLRKQLKLQYSYGGTNADLEACLDLIAKGFIKPQVTSGSLADLPKLLEDLHHGKIPSRIALIPEGIEE